MSILFPFLVILILVLINGMFVAAEFAIIGVRPTRVEQLAEEGVQLGWETRLIPFGEDVSALIYALGFANRAALSFGGVSPARSSRLGARSMFNVI